MLVEYAANKAGLGAVLGGKTANDSAKEDNTNPITNAIKGIKGIK